MSNSVAEFMSKKGIKKYANGLKDKAVKALAATAVLAAAFGTTSCRKQDLPGVQTAYAVTAEGDTLCAYQAVSTDSASYARLQDLVNSTTKSETGREVLMSISKQGTVLSLDTAGKNTFGYFLANSNSICLNQKFNDDELQSTLIHEGKHSMQWQNLPAKTSSYTYSSIVMINRAMEADAMATEAKFCFEMAEQGEPEALWAFETEHDGISEAYERACKKYGADDDKTMKETMLAWYKDKSYVGQYDGTYADFYSSVVEKRNPLRLKLGGFFSKTADADEVVTAICSWKGRSYAGTDGGILKTPETAYLDVSSHKRMTDVTSALSGKTFGTVTDTSINDFYVLKDGKVQEQTYQQVKQAGNTVSAPVKAMVGQRSQNR